MSILPPGSTIGIVGGGQLGRMLAMAAARLGYRITILEPQEDCPASQVANRHIVAQYDDEAALDELAATSAVVTYEFENVPVAAAQRMAEKTAVYPPPKALEISQDRLTEKRFLNEVGIPTAEYGQISDDGQLERTLAKLGGSGVLKTRRMGYDGKGQQVFRNAKPEDLKGVFAAMGGVPLILEKLIPFKREISIIAARAIDGSCIVYDTAENVHRDGILRTSTVPANIPKHDESAAGTFAISLLHHLDYVGILGLEFFVDKNGDLLANEFAPRVHNSGHWTEAACLVSQFELHIRCIAGLPLVTTKRHSNAEMHNLIGDDIAQLPQLAEADNVLLHLYGKAEARAGRKMGHFTRILPLKA